MNKLFQLPNLLLVLAGFAFSCGVSEPMETDTTDGPPNFSGIYPHLAYYNSENECGTGAVVPWAGDLWVITYGPHLPNGSTDKLYQVTPDLQQIVREESIGGTPANRMIHKEAINCLLAPTPSVGKGK